MYHLHFSLYCFQPFKYILFSNFFHILLWFEFIRVYISLLCLLSLLLFFCFLCLPTSCRNLSPFQLWTQEFYLFRPLASVTITISMSLKGYLFGIFLFLEASHEKQKSWKERIWGSFQSCLTCHINLKSEHWFILLKIKKRLKQKKKTIKSQVKIIKNLR